MTRLYGRAPRGERVVGRLPTRGGAARRCLYPSFLLGRKSDDSMTLTNIVDSHLPGFSRSYRQLRDYIRFKRLKTYSTELGFQLLGDAGLDKSRWDSHEIDVFRKHIADTDVFIDAGANVGLFTCLAAHARKATIAFEPHPYNLQCLYRNLEVNNFSDVEVFPIALSDRVGVCSLFGGGQGASLLEGWGGIRSNYQTLTPTNTLDNVLYKRLERQRLLIKVDVEGHELGLLTGARFLLAKAPAPVWMIEHGLTENFGGNLNPQFMELFEMFWQNNYVARTVDRVPRVVEREDVTRWVKKGKQDFGGIDFLFTSDR